MTGHLRFAVLRWHRDDEPRRLRGLNRFTLASLCLTVVLLGAPGHEALALIMGGVGNKPIRDPGWPKGAAALFNHEGRVAYWEGPPFGGGEWHSECRGDAKALNTVLAGFSQLDVKSKRVVVHDGVGHSFWLNPNREAAKRASATIDWSLMVWVPANWGALRRLPADLNRVDPREAAKGPPAQIDVYVGGGIRWADVSMPDGLDLIDQRLEAHGFTQADGIVVEGKVVDLANQRPIAAQMRLERIETLPTGGYRYVNVAETTADAQGHWVLKKAPAGWNRIVIEAKGFVPRVAGHAQFEDHPAWASYDSGLLPSAPVSGVVTDDRGLPLEDVALQFHDVVATAGGRYESTHEYAVKTGADGRFQFSHLPPGKASIWVRKKGYVRPGLGQPITMPMDDITLEMTMSGHIKIKVDFKDNPPGGYIVHMNPVGGAAVGKWSGSGNINAMNELAFEDVPPGRYVVYGQPNPGSEDQQTKSVTVDLLGGVTTELILKAK